MVGQILKIKTSIPPLGKNIVSRPTILESLETDLTTVGGFTRQLTLFSSGAGSGKSTLARTWLGGKESHAAWFSIDEADNHVERFWLYIIYALQTLNKSIGNSSLEVLQSKGLVQEANGNPDSFLIPLLNDLFALEAPSFLVLDDYHLINTRQIHEYMIFFIENLPPTLHLIVTTRSDPPWPLARWRARGLMSEIRNNELKFTQDEAGQLFSMFKNLKLNQSQLTTLYNKTEGWVTGLHLAALSLLTSSNTDEFIESFTGSHRHLLYFLSEEVLASQQERIKEFLFQTSFLNRFCAPLCDAVTGRTDSRDIINYLEQNNLFLISLDVQGIWYRYHHLFTDLLQHHLKTSQLDNMNELHERAEAWFLKADEPGEAVRQAYARNDLTRAAAIFHDFYAKLLQTESPSLLLDCLESFDTDCLVKYPRLVAHKAMITLSHTGVEECRPYLELAETLCYKDEKQQKEYEGLLSAVKAFYYINIQELTKAIKEADKALAMLSTNNHYWRMCLAIFSGDAYLFSGDAKRAYTYYIEADRNGQKLKHHYLILETGYKIATTLYFFGRLKDSEELIKKLLKSAKEQGLTRLTITGALWVLLGELLREKGELEEAEHCIERGLLLSETEKPAFSWNSLYQISLSYSKHEYDNALKTIRQIEALDGEFKMPFYITSQLVIWEARISLLLGNKEDSLNMLSTIGITEGVYEAKGLESGLLILAQILIEENNLKTHEIRKLLDFIEDYAVNCGYVKLMIETLLTKAYFEEKAGDIEAAEKLYITAVNQGKNSGYYQLFIDTAKQLEPILCSIITRRFYEVDPDSNGVFEYIKRICSSILPEDHSFWKGENRKEDSENKPAYSHQGLIDDLSTRELEILELISCGLSNQEISHKLFLSLGTIKWYSSSIYGKLGVRNRTQAIMRGRELGLIN